MTHPSPGWSPYAGSSSIILAVVLLIVTGVLLYLAFRLHHPKEIKLLAGMFLIFAVWAVFGFAYPAAPLPIALNVISKILAFATAVSLFLPSEKVTEQEKDVEHAIAFRSRCPSPFWKRLNGFSHLNHARFPER